MHANLTAFVEDPKSPIGGFARQDKTALGQDANRQALLASPTAPQINNVQPENEALRS
jgi:hypothetical protein